MKSPDFNGKRQEQATSAVGGTSEICTCCHRPLTQHNAAGECLRCLAMFAFAADDVAPPISATDAEAIGTAHRFGHFEIKTAADGSPLKLGHGAMGTTYRAEDTVLHAAVALKIIDRRVAGQTAARARFLREARAAAQLRHPNVASVFHYGEQDGECFYVMELVEGETLEAAVRRDGPFSVGLTLEIAAQIARALAAAEARGIVHRDLKPSNLMLTDREGESAKGDAFLVKVIDFGLAKTVSVIRGEAADASIRGGFVGTPAYASPEQVNGTEDTHIDTRSDIYSLGVTLWYLLCGRTPYPGATVTEMRARQARPELPWGQLAATPVPEPLKRLLTAMLSAKPEQRPASTRELLDAIRCCREQIAGTPPANLHGASRRTRTAWIAALLVLVFGVAVLAWWLTRSTPPPVAHSVAVLPFENLGTDQNEAFIASGFRDEIATALARLSALSVVGFEGARAYPPGHRELTRISHELGAAYLVEGSLRRENDRVQFSVRLLDGHHPNPLWSKQYDTPSAGLPGLRVEVARDLAGQLGVTLSPGERAALTETVTTDPAAYALYLRATEQPHLFKGADDFRQGMNARLGMLEEAVRRDPDFVLAYCAMAGMHDDMHRASEVIAEERAVDHRSLADVALEKARRLKPQDGNVHLALAYHLQAVNDDAEQARIELDLARLSLPNNAELEQSAGLIAERQGRWDEAIHAYERSAVLEPRDAQNFGFLHEVYRATRRYAAADLALDHFLAITPVHGGLYHRLLRAMDSLEERADLGPLRDALAGATPDRDSDDPSDADLFRITLGLCSHDPDAVTHALGTIQQDPIVAESWTFPKAWFEGLAARMREDTQGADQAFQRARTQLQAALQTTPLSAETLSLLAVADAHLGRREDAVREGRRACVMMPREKSALTSPAVVCNLAVVYAWTDQPDAAFALLNDLASRNAGRNFIFQPSYGDFRLNPVWDPLRRDPRFETLVQRLQRTTSP